MSEAECLGKATYKKLACHRNYRQFASTNC